jgi:c-di-GMP-binding flagellar brake protein YcgR
MEERRRSPRYKIEQAIQISLGRENFMSAEALDISKQGISCLTNEQIEPYTRIFLVLSIKEGNQTREITCEGMVLYTEKKGHLYKLGLEFTEMKDEDRDALKDHLASFKG